MDYLGCYPKWFWFLPIVPLGTQSSHWYRFQRIQLSRTRRSRGYYKHSQLVGQGHLKTFRATYSLIYYEFESCTISVLPQGFFPADASTFKDMLYNSYTLFALHFTSTLTLKWMLYDHNPSHIALWIHSCLQQYPIYLFSPFFSFFLFLSISCVFLFLPSHLPLSY